MGMMICLAPRGSCDVGASRSRWTCRVFGRASIFASSFLVRRRMTRMPLAGYPALQYLQSGRVRKDKTRLENGLLHTTPVEYHPLLPSRHEPLKCRRFRQRIVREAQAGTKVTPTMARKHPSIFRGTDSSDRYFELVHQFQLRPIRGE